MEVTLAMLKTSTPDKSIFYRCECCVSENLEDRSPKKLIYFVSKASET